MGWTEAESKAQCMPMPVRVCVSLVEEAGRQAGRADGGVHASVHAELSVKADLERRPAQAQAWFAVSESL